jgi:hypothetical protein
LSIIICKINKYTGGDFQKPKNKQERPEVLPKNPISTQLSLSRTRKFLTSHNSNKASPITPNHSCFFQKWSPIISVLFQVMGQDGVDTKLVDP